ncbi:MAG TPA: hypothetical protein DEO43_01600 [Halieaceae bacterium]|nr:hypothetical protein [Halieaceae bacterium]
MRVKRGRHITDCTAWRSGCGLRITVPGVRIALCGIGTAGCESELQGSGCRLQVAGCRLQNVNFGQQTVGTQMTFKTPPIPLTTAFTQSIAQPKKEAYPTIVTS